MQSILLAAGQGTRLRPFTDHQPKCMVPYQDKPIIDHILEVQRASGVDDIVIVKGYCAEALHREGTTGCENKAYATTNMVTTLFSAQEYIKGDVLISYTDIIYRREILAALLACDEDIAITVDLDWQKLWEQRMDNPLEDAETLELGPSGEVLSLGKKPESYSEVQGQYMGLIKLTDKGSETLKSHYNSLDRDKLYDGKDFENMYMTSLLQSLIDAGHRVQSVPVRGGWLEIDCPGDMAIELSPYKEA